MFELELSTSQMITFVMVDSNGVEVTGIGSGFTLELSKAGGAFAASTGTKAEIGSGWYRYTLTAAETDTPGPLSVRVTGAGAVQQNLEYIVLDRAITAIAFTYTVTNSVTLDPIDGVQVWFCTDANGDNVVWSGFTDAFGVARDEDGNLPRLDPGSYFIFRSRSGFVFSDPDTEVVGP